MSERPNYRFYIRIKSDAEKRHEKYKAVVTPGHCYVQAGDEVVFLTDNAAEMWFPGIDELFENPPKGKIIQINPDDDPTPFTVKSDYSGKEYPFAVYVTIDDEQGLKDFAEGCTAPRVIIE